MPSIRDRNNTGGGQGHLVSPDLKLENPGATTILLVSIFCWISLEMRAIILLHSEILSSAVAPNLISGLLGSVEDAG